MSSATVVIALGAYWRLRRLVRAGLKPVVFLSRFATETPVAYDASLDHLVALRERLTANPHINSRVELRIVRASLSSKQAERLAEVDGACAVVFGDVRAQRDHARWAGQIVARWPSDEMPRGHFQPPTLFPTEGWFDAAETLTERRLDSAALPLDADFPLRRLVARHFHAAHADAIEGTILVILAQRELHLLDEESGDGDGQARVSMRELVAAAEKFRPALSPRACAQLLLARDDAFAEFGEGLVGFDRLERALAEEVDHVDIWRWLSAHAMAVKWLGEPFPPHRLIRYARGVVEREPQSAEAHYNLAMAYLSVNQVREGQSELKEAEALAQRDHVLRHFIYVSRGQVLHELGDLAGAEDALMHALKLHVTVPSLIALGELYEDDGRASEARTMYRRALVQIARRHLLTPDHLNMFVPALMGYWRNSQAIRADRSFPIFYFFVSVIASPRLPLPGRLRYWLLWLLLRAQYEFRPQDLRLVVSLGYVSIAVQRYELAITISALAYGASGNLGYYAVEVVAHGLKGELEACADGLRELRTITHYEDLKAVSPQPALEERIALAASPFAFAPWLMRTAHGDATLAAIADEFSEAFNGAHEVRAWARANRHVPRLT